MGPREAAAAPEAVPRPPSFPVAALPSFTALQLCFLTWSQIESMLDQIQYEHALNRLSQRTVNQGGNAAPNEKLEQHLKNPRMLFPFPLESGKGPESSHSLRPVQDGCSRCKWPNTKTYTCVSTSCTFIQQPGIPVHLLRS